MCNSPIFLQRSKISILMHFPGEKMTEKELEEMVREADKDNDGLINYEGTKTNHFPTITSRFSKNILLQSLSKSCAATGRKTRKRRRSGRTGRRRARRMPRTTTVAATAAAEEEGEEGAATATTAAAAPAAAGTTTTQQRRNSNRRRST